jgi:hypothetical protein
MDCSKTDQAKEAIQKAICCFWIFWQSESDPGEESGHRFPNMEDGSLH